MWYSILSIMSCVFGSLVVYTAFVNLQTHLQTFICPAVIRLKIQKAACPQCIWIAICELKLQQHQQLNSQSFIFILLLKILCLSAGWLSVSWTVRWLHNQYSETFHANIRRRESMHVITFWRQFKHRAVGAMHHRIRYRMIPGSPSCLCCPACSILQIGPSRPWFWYP